MTCVSFLHQIAQNLVTQWGLPVMGVLHREHCTNVGGDQCLKDISRLGRDLSRVVMIEADPSAAKVFPHNTVLIKEYDASNAQDKELEGLRLYLKELANQQGDLRPSLRSKGQDPETISKMVVSQETRDGLSSWVRATAQSVLGK
eukprot:Protomagalhaensia_sp_Gyna_25__1496@NODE_1766_length_1551_cov_8_048280_g1447_i0_p2_GENE_NODE_1766_length_1551_cov_8_048280_g1447_i0NODE_1766_length_1551_cov_8_048280_g1447_i0_p2_ORF_typecomplete_len145_score18_56NIF/PF03031_18/3_8e15_NODE_1766_length_1551_cov_8_048280_g1447_i06021036